MPYAQVSGIRLHYEESGRGPQAVLFVHGWPGCWLWWEETIRRLPPRYHTYAMDIRGAGESDKPADGYSVEQYADDVFALARTVGLERFVYVGHSTGGAIGYQLTLRHQEVLQALVLVDPAPADGLPVTGDEQQMASFFERMRDPEQLAGFVQRIVMRRPITPYLLDMIVQWAVRVSEGYLRDTVYALQALRLGSRLGEIRVPALMVAGDQDSVVRLDTMLEAARRIPDCGLHVFHRVGHAPMMEVPDEFARVLADFIDHATGDEGGAES